MIRLPNFNFSVKRYLPVFIIIIVILAFILILATGSDGRLQPPSNTTLGAWQATDDATVMKLIFGNYDPATRNSSWNPTDTELKDLSLRTTGDQNVLYANLSGSKLVVALYATTTSGLRTYVLTYANDPNCDYPTCGPIIGGYELDKAGGNWRLDSSNNIVSQAGEFGIPPIATIVDLGVSATTSLGSVVKTITDASSRANPAFLLTDESIGQGIDNYSLDVVASVSGTLKDVLTVDNVAEDNSGAVSSYPYSYDSSITLIPNGTLYDDILVNTSGTNGDGASPAKKISEQKKFMFNGGEYVKVSD
jgi:hypothetical protein